MKVIKLSLLGLFLITTLSAFSQVGSGQKFVKSNFRELQMRCIKKKVESKYDINGFEILSDYNNGYRFFFPGDKKYRWKVWKSTTQEDYFVIISLHRDRKTGKVKSSKVACVTIDLVEGVIHDSKLSKDYILYFDTLLARYKKDFGEENTSKLDVLRPVN